MISDLSKFDNDMFQTVEIRFTKGEIIANSKPTEYVVLNKLLERINELGLQGHKYVGISKIPRKRMLSNSVYEEIQYTVFVEDCLELNAR